jgi:acetyltransferase-like isoleucine patch superfamily enzyme
MSLNQAIDTPWKAFNELRRIASSPFIRLYFIVHGVSWQPGWRIFGKPLIQKHKGSTIEIGKDFIMRNWLGSNPLGINHRSVLATWSADAVIQIGNHVGITGVSIVAESRIIIGDRVRIGANSTIVDTDFHPISSLERQIHPNSGKSEEIIIDDDVFIGMNVLILKGSRIGKGSVVGAGSVVVGKIPAGVIVAGNPARIITEIDAE